MSKNKKVSKGDYPKEDVNLFNCKYLGAGHNGIVYTMQDGRVIKIFKEVKEGIREYNILKSVNGNKYFPRVYECGANYMIRDYVGGIGLKSYIRKHGTNKKLIVNIIELMREFKRLNFTKIDIRCKDIFVQEDLRLMVIDPKSVYTKTKKYPHRLMIGLDKVGALDLFKEVLKKDYPKLYTRWIVKGRNLEENWVSWELL